MIFNAASSTSQSWLTPLWKRTYNDPLQRLSIISPSQSAFVPGCLITDNVLLAFETNHFLYAHTKGRNHFMNIKLDIKQRHMIKWNGCFSDGCWENILHKSSATFSRSTPMELQQYLAETLGICLENKHEIYLGLLAMAFRSKRALFAALKDRIWRLIQGWHEKTISQVGKAFSIQQLFKPIPSYAMSCFQLPCSLLKELHSLAANFFWHGGDRKEIHWLAWDKMCMSKSVEGLGFRNLEAFNLALLGKQLWRILSRPHSLVGRVFKQNFPELTFLCSVRLSSILYYVYGFEPCTFGVSMAYWDGSFGEYLERSLDSTHTFSSSYHPKTSRQSDFAS
ncbi:hypothetical protein Sango_0671600 [Sesamum angolense]|uniref:Reverse transcriptase zinc-binding domain-containing protein n=1 Tax=Sesamum angolense TaxID=2727404 RepID=A0AAE1X7R6_9LAMI|nr:hypothetical protein Sango_0671600 [Sesamum angolense]